MPVFASSVPGNFVVSIGVSVALMFSVSFLDGLPQASLITPTTNALAILGVLTLWAMTGMSKKPWHCFVAGSVATMALCGAPGGRPSPGSPVALAAGKLWSSPPPVIRVSSPGVATRRDQPPPPLARSLAARNPHLARHPPRDSTSTFAGAPRPFGWRWPTRASRTTTRRSPLTSGASRGRTG